LSIIHVNEFFSFDSFYQPTKGNHMSLINTQVQPFKTQAFHNGNYAAFQKAGAEVYIITTDTHFSHKVWHETSPAVGKAKFPLVGDPTHQLTRAFGVHIEEEGLALRGTFVINPEGMIKTVEIHSNEIARDVSETLRKLTAAQYTAANPGQVCPAKWKEGAKTLAPSIDLVGKI
jgi:peroxiredoxin